MIRYKTNTDGVLCIEFVTLDVKIKHMINLRRMFIILSVLALSGCSPKEFHNAHEEGLERPPKIIESKEKTGRSPNLITPAAYGALHEPLVKAISEGGNYALIQEPQSKKLRVWNLKYKVPTVDLDVNSGEVFHNAFFSKNNHYVLAEYRDGLKHRGYVWNTKTGQRRQIFNSFDDYSKDQSDIIEIIKRELQDRAKADGKIVVSDKIPKTNVLGHDIYLVNDEKRSEFDSSLKPRNDIKKYNSEVIKIFRCFSGNGRYAALATSFSADIIDIENNRLVFSIESTPMPYVACSEDGHYFAVGAKQNIKLWDITNESIVNEFEIPSDEKVTGIALSSGDIKLAVTSWNGNEANPNFKIRLFDKRSNSSYREIDVPSYGGTKLVPYTEISPNGNVLVLDFGMPDDKLIGNLVIDIRSGKQIVTENDQFFKHVSFSKDGDKILLEELKKNHIVVKSVKTDQTLLSTEVLSLDGIFDGMSSISSDGLFVLYGKDNGILKQSINSNEKVPVLKSPDSTAILHLNPNIAISNSKKYCLVSSQGVLQLWDLKNGVLLWSKATLSAAKKISFISDEKEIMANFQAETVLIETNSGKIKTLYNTYPTSPTNYKGPASIEFLSETISGYDGRIIKGRASVSENGLYIIFINDNDKETQIINTSNGSSLNYKASKTEDVPSQSSAAELNNLSISISTSADGQIGVIKNQNQVELWDLASNKSLGNLNAFESSTKEDKEESHNYYLSKSGRLVIIESPGQRLKTLNIKSGKLENEYQHAMFVHNTDQIVIKQNDVVQLVNTESSEVLLNFPNEFDFDVTEKLVSSSDNTLLLAIRSDGSLQVMSLKTGKLLASLYILPEQGKTDGWLWVDSFGRFDTNFRAFESLDNIYWTFDGLSDPIEPEVFMREYYEPKLISRLLRGEPFTTVKKLSKLNRLQPEVKNISVTKNHKKPDHADVIVNITQTKKGELNSGAQDLMLFRDGQLVGINTLKSEDIRFDPKSGTASVPFPDIQLPSHTDKVSFSAYAFNADGVRSKRYIVDFEIKPRILRKERRAYILAIGVSDYQRDDLQLQFAAGDAQALQETLTNRITALKQTDLKQYDSVVPIPLINSHATKDQIKAVFAKLAGKPDTILTAKIPNVANIQLVTPDDLLIIAYSGHGYSEHGTGKFYLFPHDTGPGQDKVIYESTLKNSISTDDLSEWLRDVDAGEIVMIVDACNSSASVEGDPEHKFKPGPMGSRGFGQLAYDKAMRVLTASQAEEVAREFPELKHGILTYALIPEALDQGLADALPKDNMIRVGEWLTYGLERVPELNEQMGQGKSPVKGFHPTVRLEAIRNAIRQTQQPGLFDFANANQNPVITRISAP
jgi:uncharacterized caspase-like protein